MTSSITTQPQHQAVPASEARRDWCCGTPVTDAHVPGCRYDPEEPENENVVAGPQAISEPPPVPPTEVPAAARRRSYGIVRAAEFDLELPSGSFVRMRKLAKGQLLQLNLVEVLDGFTPELLADLRSGDETAASDAAARALTDPQRSSKIFGPVDRVVHAAVVIPTVVLDDHPIGDQVSVRDVELEDKLAIFNAAIGEQLAALKSVREQQTPGL